MSLSAMFVLLFILMVGATPSVVRAGVMAMLALTAKGMRRTYNVGRALALAALCLHDQALESSDTCCMISVLSFHFLRP